MSVSTNKIYHTGACGICLEDYNMDADNDCTILKCGHVYHRVCIASWISHKPCPACKKKAILPLSKEEIAKAGTRSAVTTGKVILYLIRSTIILVVGNAILDFIWLGGRFKTEAEQEKELQEIFKITGQERPMIHSDNWYYWLAGAIALPFGVGLVKSLYKCVTGKLFANVRHIQYRPPRTA